MSDSIAQILYVLLQLTIIVENILRTKRYFLIFMTTGQTFIVQFIFWRSLNICLHWKETLKENGKHICQISIFFFERVKDMDRQFSPVLYLIDNDCEKYFEKLIICKESNEKDYLSRRPFLAFEPYRHKKLIAKSYRKTIRG